MYNTLIINSCKSRSIGGLFLVLTKRNYIILTLRVVVLPATLTPSEPLEATLMGLSSCLILVSCVCKGIELLSRSPSKSAEIYLSMTLTVTVTCYMQRINDPRIHFIVACIVTIVNTLPRSH